MPYGHEDYQYLGTWFVSHARFVTVGFSMGSAIIGVDYWLTNKELSKLDKKVGELQQGVSTDLSKLDKKFGELQQEVKDLKQEMKHDIAELQKGMYSLLQK